MDILVCHHGLKCRYFHLPSQAEVQTTWFATTGKSTDIIVCHGRPKYGYYGLSTLVWIIICQSQVKTWPWLVQNRKITIHWAPDNKIWMISQIKITDNIHDGFVIIIRFVIYVYLIIELYGGIAWDFIVHDISLILFIILKYIILV